MPGNRYTSAHWGSYRAKGVGADLRLEPLQSDPSPSHIGRGWLDATRDANARIAAPMVRKGWLQQRNRSGRGSDAFVQVPWDEALDLAASELDRVRKENGNGAIFGGSYGWASAGRFHHAQGQLRRFLNTIGGFVAVRDTYSHAAAEVLLPHVTGMTNRMFEDGNTSWPLIAEHCELLVCFGGMSGRPAQIASGGTTSHEVESWLQRAVAGGTRIINISPNRTDTAQELGARWIAPRPNTDTALMMGIAHCLVANGQHDKAFLERCTSGWPTFERYLTGATDGVAKTAQWAASITGIDAATITALAHEMARSRTMVSMAWGIQRADHGEQPLWMGITLAAMLGQIGQPGCGFGFGHGSTTPVGRPVRHVEWPAFPQGANPVDDFIPVARLSDMLLSPGQRYTYDGQNRSYPDIKLVYWAGGNPFHHHQDLNRLALAWARPDTVIVNDLFWTATARRADIVFPISSPLERRDIMINRRDPTLLFMEQLLEPFGDCRNDHAVFCGLAKRMGTLQAFTDGKSEEQWLRDLWSRSQRVAQGHGFALPDFDDFCEQGRFDIPAPEQTRIQFGDFVSDPSLNPLATPSGKIEICSPTIASFALADCPGHPVWIEPSEWLGSSQAQGKFHLVSGQPLARLHGQLDNGPVSRASKIKGREVVCLHPDNARSLGIEHGDIVLLQNSRGRVLAAASLTDAVRIDTAWLGTGAWFDPQTVHGQAIEVHGNPNVLTLDKGTSGLAQGNIAHTALVQITLWTGELPDLTIDRPPPIVPT